MKKILALSFLFISIAAFAAKRDSTFQRHMFSVSMTNAMSHTFYDGPYGPTVKTNSKSEFAGIFQSRSMPDYAMNIKVGYSLGISDLIRIETGIGYQIEGSTTSGELETELFDITKFTSYGYLGSLNIPLHVKFQKHIRKGVFTCEFGPNFTLPVNNFSRFKEYWIVGGASNKTYSGHERYDDVTIRELSTMGFDLKVGYEKRLKSSISIDIGPIINFTNLVVFDKDTRQQYTSGGYRPYRYYIGLDVAVNFGLKK